LIYDHCTNKRIEKRDAITMSRIETTRKRGESVNASASTKRDVSSVIVEGFSVSRCFPLAVLVISSIREYIILILRVYGFQTEDRLLSKRKWPNTRFVPSRESVASPITPRAVTFITPTKRGSRCMRDCRRPSRNSLVCEGEQRASDIAPSCCQFRASRRR